MKELYPLTGVVPIVNTPLTEDDKLDVASLERLLEEGIADGVSGFIVPAVASEVAKLTPDERHVYVREVLRIVGGRVTVVAGASDPDARRARALAEDAVALGVDGVLCAVPVPLIEDHDGAVDYFREVARAGMPMLMIQDLHWGGYGMARKTLMQLWDELDSFRCLKLETVPSGAKTSELIEATDDPAHHRLRLVAAAVHRGPRPRHALHDDHGHQPTLRARLSAASGRPPRRGARAVSPRGAVPGFRAPVHRHLNPLL